LAFGPAVQVENEDQESKKQPAKQNIENMDEPESVSASVTPVELAPHAIRLHLWDGSIIGGELTIDNVNIETEFGRLQVPVEKIIRIHPGLNSLPELDERIKRLVEQLDDREFTVRQEAHKEILRFGTCLRKLMESWSDGGSAERKKHLAEIQIEIEEMVEEEGFPPKSWALISGDTIETADFAIVGKVLETEFPIVSRHGSLVVNLADVQLGDRSYLKKKDNVLKSIEIPGNSFFQSSPVNTHIRINRGDKISIRADGSVQWASWGELSSTPDGIGNQGNWRGINCGTLAARIGSNGEPIAVGRSKDWVAKTSGTLYLSIAMQDGYATNEGYTWPGSYKSRVTVAPSE
jgi:hypothetical protein